MPSASETLRVGSEEVTVKVASSATAGALFAIEVVMPPGGGPPMMHRHAPAEVYRVAQGELALYVEDDGGEVVRHVAGPGDLVAIPPRRAHTVRNESGSPAHALALFTPGAEIERFVRAAGDLGAAGTPAAEDVIAIAAASGIEFTGPIPADTWLDATRAEVA